jgi:hypothetical protein
MATMSLIGILLTLQVERTAGLAVTGMSLLLLVLVMFETLAVGWFYRADSAGIYIKRSFKTAHIPAESIREVHSVSWPEARQILEAVQQKEAASIDSLDMRAGFKAQIESGYLTKFCSVPITFLERRAGSPQNITGARAYSRGEFILVTMKNSRRYLLSPDDTTGFIEACRLHNIGTDQK